MLKQSRVRPVGTRGQRDPRRRRARPPLGAVPLPVPEEAGAHPSALRGGKGKPPLGLQACQLGEGTTWLTHLAGNAKADPTGIALHRPAPRRRSLLGMGEAERRRVPRSARLPFLVPAQSVTVTKSPGGETLDAARRRAHTRAWARPQSPRDFCTVCLAIL